MSAPAPLPPSRARMAVSAVLVIVCGVFLYVAVVLPAEQGVDPTGIGTFLGLTEMGEIKLEIAEESAAEALEVEMARLADSADAAESTAMLLDSSRARDGEVRAPGESADVTELVVPPSGGIEVVARMNAGDRLRYSWRTADSVVLNYVVIGDSAGFASGWGHVYRRGYSTASRVGVIVAAFDGEHGWYFHNSSADSVSVLLQTSGAYRSLRNSGR